VVARNATILMVVSAFVVGFVTGFIVAIQKGREMPLHEERAGRSVSPLDQIPLSVETMEKIEDAKENLRKDPRDTSAWRRLGDIYSESDRFQQAIEAYSQYLAIKPEDHGVRFRLGGLLRRWGDVDGAIEEFRRVAEGDPTHGESRYLLGLMLWRDRKDVPGAVRAWKDYLRVEPGGKRAEWVRGQVKKLEGAEREGVGQGGASISHGSPDAVLTRRRETSYYSS
jgi:tetratricopeptide (TPR) repeat protein